MLMSPASCAQRIHESRLPAIEAELDMIKRNVVPVDEHSVYKVTRSQEKRSVLIVETNVIEAIQAIEQLIEFTPAWQDNIEIRFAPRADEYHIYD